MAQEIAKASTIFDEKSDASDPKMPGTRNEPAIRSLIAQQQFENAIDTAIKGNVISKVESIFEGMVDVLLNERGHLFLALASRPTLQRPKGIVIDTPSPSQHAQQICFPGRDENEAWRFGKLGIVYVLGGN